MARSNAQVHDPDTNTTYFHNLSTGATAWELPLPAGWEEVHNPEAHSTYYYKAATGESRWQHPGTTAAAEDSALGLDEAMAAKAEVSARPLPFNWCKSLPFTRSQW